MKVLSQVTGHWHRRYVSGTLEWSTRVQRLR